MLARQAEARQTVYGKPKEVVGCRHYQGKSYGDVTSLIVIDNSSRVSVRSSEVSMFTADVVDKPTHTESYRNYCKRLKMDGKTIIL
jgi:hypothetical protein